MRFVLGHEGWGGIQKSKKNKTLPGKEKDSSKVVGGNITEASFEEKQFGWNWEPV